LGAHVVLPYQTPLSAFEWTTLLGNLLDNALEASGGANAPYIQINVSFAHGMLHIKMENAKAEGYAPPKKGRGLGLKRVAAVLDDHRGYMELEDGKNTFITHIILPLEE
jgi:two-component system sensor histidine kinase AgrC